MMSVASPHLARRSDNANGSSPTPSTPRGPNTTCLDRRASHRAVGEGVRTGRVPATWSPEERLEVGRTVSNALGSGHVQRRL